MEIDSLFEVNPVSVIAQPHAREIAPNASETELDANNALNATRANHTQQAEESVSDTAATADAPSTTLAPESAEDAAATDSTPPPTLAQAEADYQATLAAVLGPDPDAASTENDVSDHVNILV